MRVSQNGMCQTTAGHNGRGFCTDPTWKGPNCLNACTDSSVHTCILPFTFRKTRTLNDLAQNGGNATDRVDMFQYPDVSVVKLKTA